METGLRAVPTAESQLSSARPAYAVLDNFILRIIDLYQMPQWKDSLKEYMEERKERKGTQDKRVQTHNLGKISIHYSLIFVPIHHAFGDNW